MDNKKETQKNAPAAPQGQASELDETFAELALANSKVAMDAAMTLMGSRLPRARAQGMALGAAAFAAQTGALSRGKATMDFVALMLSGSESDALSFFAQAECKIRANVSGLLAGIPAQRVVFLETSFPGFASKARPETLMWAPEATALLCDKELLPPTRALAAVCAAGAAKAHCDRFWRGDSKTASKEGETREAMISFGSRGEAAAPGFCAKLWDFYWRLPKAGKARSIPYGPLWEAMPGVDPFAGLPAAGELDATRASWVGALALLALPQAGSDLPANAALFRDCGRYLAQNPGCMVPFLRGGKGKPSEAKLRSPAAQSEDDKAWASLIPLNPTAELLGMFDPMAGHGGGRGHYMFLAGARERPSTEELDARRQRLDCWIALAEGLAEGGAEPPKFKVRSEHPDFKDAWPEARPACLGAVLMAMSGRALAPAGSALAPWLASGSSPGEPALAREFIRVAEASLASRPKHRNAFAGALMLVEVAEIGLAAKAPRKAVTKAARRI